MFLNAFRGKTVLVTGHTGFKGAWLSIWLEQLGARVIGYALAPPTCPSLFDTCNLESRLEHIEGDVRDIAQLQQVVVRSCPDFVFHLAAQSLVLPSYETPRETFDVNVMGTVSLLEAIRLSRHPCTIVMVTTDKVYENREWEYSYREVDPLGGYDPYSASKSAMEIVISSYRRSFFPVERVAEHGVKLASARAGNVIGGGDWAAHRIVPDAVRALSANMPFVVRHPDALRPWQHVLEPLSGYLWLAAKMSQGGGEKYADAWNFGPAPNTERTVADLADAIVAAWGSGHWIAGGDSDPPHEARQLKLSIERAYSYLGWFPLWDFTTTVNRTIAWYKDAMGRSWEEVYSLCVNEILAYTDIAAKVRMVWAS